MPLRPEETFTANRTTQSFKYSLAVIQSTVEQAMLQCRRIRASLHIYLLLDQDQLLVIEALVEIGMADPRIVIIETETEIETEIEEETVTGIEIAEIEETEIATMDEIAKPKERGHEVDRRSERKRTPNAARTNQPQAL
jgi:hypothetical protein